MKVVPEITADARSWTASDTVLPPDFWSWRAAITHRSLAALFPRHTQRRSTPPLSRSVHGAAPHPSRRLQLLVHTEGGVSLAGMMCEAPPCHRRNKYGLEASQNLSPGILTPRVSQFAKFRIGDRGIALSRREGSAVSVGSKAVRARPYLEQTTHEGRMLFHLVFHALGIDSGTGGRGAAGAIGERNASNRSAGRITPDHIVMKRPAVVDIDIWHHPGAVPAPGVPGEMRRDGDEGLSRGVRSQAWGILAASSMPSGLRRGPHGSQRGILQAVS